ncbi:MAG: hypothetical protein WDN00_19445 [Limisphaerales bacterium]
MKEHFQLARSWKEKHASVIIHKNATSSVSHLDVYKGRCDANYLSNFQMLKFKKGYIPDMLPNNLGWPIFSSRCCARLVESGAGANILFHPLKKILPLSFPNALSEYCVLSAKTVIDCLDLDSDQVDWFDESKEFVSSYTRLDLVSSKIPPEANFFGILRDSSIHVVSDDVKKELELDQPDGIAFRACFMI